MLAQGTVVAVGAAIGHIDCDQRHDRRHKADRNAITDIHTALHARSREIDDRSMVGEKEEDAGYHSISNELPASKPGHYNPAVNIMGDRHRAQRTLLAMEVRRWRASKIRRRWTRD